MLTSADYKVSLKSSDAALDMVTNKMRIRGGVYDSSVAISYTDEILFSVIWKSPCRQVVLSLASKYTDLSTTVLGAAVSNSQPSVILTPNLSTCGSIVVTPVWPNSNRV